MEALGGSRWHLGHWAAAVNDLWVEDYVPPVRNDQLDETHPPIYFS